MTNLWGTLPVLLLGLVVLYAAWTWWARRRADQYDLSRLRDAPRTGMYDQTALLPEEEPDDDWVNEDSGPYCHACGEAYPPGTSACLRCRRPLG